MADPVTESAQRRSRLPAAFTWMPVRLVLFFVALAALDLVCQLLGARLLHAVPRIARDAAWLGYALGLSAAMIATYRWLVRHVEGREPEEPADGRIGRCSRSRGRRWLVYRRLRNPLGARGAQIRRSWGDYQALLRPLPSPSHRLWARKSYSAAWHFDFSREVSARSSL